MINQIIEEDDNEEIDYWVYELPESEITPAIREAYIKTQNSKNWINI